ncbi:MAG: DegV family protein [Gemmiger sp.]|nr:DegV family protein [Gemmiger sp.]
MENQTENTKFALISDSSCDLPDALAAQNGVEVVPFYVSFDGETYRKEGVELSVRDFYRQMVENPGVYPKSSLPAVEDYRAAFAPHAAAGEPVLCICITTKFSGSMQAALTAAALVRDEYPSAEIAVMDATVNTVLQGLLVMQAAALRDNGASLAEATARLEEIKGSGRIFFTVGDIAYLRAGGRIGKVAGMAGALLGVKPVITLKQGEIFPSGLGRARQKNLEKTRELLVEYLRELGPEKAKRCVFVVGYGYDPAEAEEYRNALAEAIRPVCGAVPLPMWQIGAAIGVHTGPHPLGVGVLEQA